MIFRLKLCLVCGGLLCSSVFALVDHRLNYKTLTSERVSVHSPEKFLVQAEYIMKLAQNFIAVLRQNSGLYPTVKIQIIITDQFDMANGMATVYPYNYIVVYLRPPPSFSILENYQDWLSNLLFHEMVHIFNMDQSTGLWRFSRYLFGRHPLSFFNGALPQWMIEGNAVYQESQNGHGRLQSNLAKMYFKAQLHHAVDFDLTDISHFGYEFPYGNMAYLYGGFFVEYLIKQKPLENSPFERVFNSSAGNLLPFRISDDIEKVFGRSMHALFSEWQQQAREKVYDEYKQYLAQQKGYHPRYFSISSEAPMRPRLAFDQSSLLVKQQSASSGNRLASYLVAAMNSGSAKKIQPTWQYSKANDFADYYRKGEQIYFSMLDYQDIYQIRFQLHQSEGNKNSVVLPDAAIDSFTLHEQEKTVHLYYSQYQDNRFYLKKKISDRPDSLILYESEYPLENIRVNTNLIAVGSKTAATPSRYEIILFQEAVKKAVRLTAPCSLKQPDFGATGVLFFSADCDGRYNIYSVDLNPWLLNQKSEKSVALSVRQHSYEFLGAFSPQYLSSQEQILFEHFGKNQFQLASVSVADGVNAPFEVVVQALEITNSTSVNLTATADYSLWQSFFPYSWTPLINFAVSDQLQITDYGAEMVMQDTLQKHSLYVSVNQSQPIGNLSLQMQYSILAFLPQLTLNLFSSSYRFHQKLLLTSNLQSYDISDRVDLQFYFPFILSGDWFGFELGGGWQHLQSFLFFRQNWYQQDREESLLNFAFEFNRRDKYYKSFYYEKGDALRVEAHVYNWEKSSRFFDALAHYEYNFNGFFANHAASPAIAFFQRFDLQGSDLVRENFSSFLKQQNDSIYSLRGFTDGAYLSLEAIFLQFRYILPLCYCEAAFSMFDFVMLSKAGLSLTYQSAFFDLRRFSNTSFAQSFSAELLFDGRFGYRLDLRFSLGVAMGLGNFAETQYFFKIANSILYGQAGYGPARGEIQRKKGRM